MTRRSCISAEIFFVCNEVTAFDSKQYNAGGLGRCSEERAALKLAECLKYGTNDRYAEARKRLDILSQSSHDLFASDVLYHKRCYSLFVNQLRNSKWGEDNLKCLKETQIREILVLEEFLDLFEKRVLGKEEAYLMSALLIDIKEMSEDHGLTEPVIKYSNLLKKKLQEQYHDEIAFYKIGRRQIVYASRVNPCLYAAATLEGSGLRDEDICRTFARMVRRKVFRNEPENWPIDFDSLAENLENTGPSEIIYNTIAWSLEPDAKKTQDGFVNLTSKIRSDRVWSISSNLESLITKRRSAKSIMLGLIINRITGSKEVATLLSKLGHGISYNDIRTLNNAWAQTVTHNSIAGIPSGFMKQKPLHIAIDNSDGKQETLTGSKTTHFTNGIIFQGKSNKEQVAIAKDKKAGELLQEPIDYGVYKITKKMSPPVITAFKDRNERKNLDWDLKRNIVWVLAGAVGCTLTDNTVEKRAPLSSWTAFMKSVTNVETSKVHIDYLQVVPFPPKDIVCKWYLDQMVKVTQEMDLEFIFLHSDEAVHSKIMILKWINQGDYDRIVPLMGGFHTILVKLKLIHKRFGALGMRDWWIDSNAIAEGSVDKAAEGKHYSRAIRLHKQSFEALLRYRFEKLRNERDIHFTLKKDLEQLIKMPSFETLETVINNEYFEEVLNDLLYTNGPQSYQFVSYIKDVSLLLSIISSVRENNIEIHLEAERALLPDLFALDIQIMPGFSLFST